MITPCNIGRKMSSHGHPKILSLCIQACCLRLHCRASYPLPFHSMHMAHVRPQGRTHAHSIYASGPALAGGLSRRSIIGDVWDCFSSKTHSLQVMDPMYSRLHIWMYRLQPNTSAGILQANNVSATAMGCGCSNRQAAIVRHLHGRCRRQCKQHCHEHAS